MFSCTSKTLRAVAVAVIALATFAGAERAAEAHGTQVPEHGWVFDPAVYCTNGGYYGSPLIRVHHPEVMRSWYGGNERVWFRADVYRYGSSGWYRWDTSSSWMYSFANARGLYADHGGYSAWHFPNGSHGGTSYRAFSPPHGKYRIVLQFNWAWTGVTHAETRDCTI